ncbi:MAG: citrate synthase, partial [Anaerovoracaceae bacterium]
RRDAENNKVPVPGELYYRGYSIRDLVKNYSEENRFGFEEVTYLLLFGELPTKNELHDFNKLLSEKRELPVGFSRDMILTTPSKNIMNKLSRSILALYCYDENPDDWTVTNVLRQSIDLIGYFPTLIAYAYQAKRSFFDNESLHLHYPIAELSTAENILRMIRPMGEYTEFEAKILDLCLILHAEHGGGNNSSFTTHVITSSGTDTYATMSAAVGSLKGPLHGGANISVLNMIEDLKKNVKNIGHASELDQYLIKVLKKEANDKSGLIYGMGHAIYTVSDPRAELLKGMARKLAMEKNVLEDYELCEYIENNAARLYSEVHGVEKVMCANVDLYSGFVYTALDIPMEIATPLFATARMSGWAAHRLEEIIAGKKLMRPAYTCVQEVKPFVAISNRKENKVSRKEHREALKEMKKNTMELKNLQKEIAKEEAKKKK